MAEITEIINYVIIIFLIYVVIIATCKEKESFTEILTVKLTDKEFQQEIDNLVGIVGQMVSDVYNYLRSQYSTGKSYKPLVETDELLKDSQLPKIRIDISEIIDATRKRLITKYGVDIVKKMDQTYSVYYEKSSNGVLKITHVIYGIINVYFV